MISLKNIGFSYDGENKVLDDFSLTLPQKGAVCFSGTSGCGKTTLLRLIAGLETPQEGTVTGLDGLRIAFVFQENRLLPWETALENAAIASDRSGAKRWLERVGLGNDMDKYPDELSGGMKRRIAIARALAAPADVLILDEPFVGLDADLWKSVAGHIMKAYTDKLIVLVTHSAEHAEAFHAPVWCFRGPPLRKI